MMDDELPELKPPQAESLEGRDITIARYHFPHHYIRSRQRSLHRPVSHQIAKSYGVGVLPNDRMNLASLEENTYHVPPIVTRSYMKLFIQGLKHSSGTDQQSTNLSRSSRMIRRANIVGSTPSATLNVEEMDEEMDIVDCCEDYMLSVDVLKKKIETIVQRLILPDEPHLDGKVDRINNLALSNKHYVNISIMLGKMY